MPWFKVDDKITDHRKVRRLGKDKLPAMGLWTLCGAWSSDNLTDGFMPAEVVQRFDQTEHYAQRLVAAELWAEAEHDGERGYRFVDWGEWQPTKAEVVAEREAARERMKKVRQGRRPSERSAEVRPKFGGSSGEHIEPPGQSVSFGRTPGERSGELRAKFGNPVPSRPDPTSSSSYSSDSTPLALIADALGLNLDEEEDEKEVRTIYDLIAADPSVKSPAGFIRTIALNGDLRTYQARARTGNTPAAAPVHAGPIHAFQTDGARRNPRCVHNDCQFPEAHAVHRVTAGATA